MKGCNMAHSPHLIREHSQKTGYIAWCGYKSFSDYSMTGYEQHPAMCSKCSAKFYAEKTKTNFPYRLADRLDLTNDPRRYTYKSIYPIIRVEDGADIGFVTITNGWGKSWEVRAWEDRISIGDVNRNAMPDLTMSPGVTYRKFPDDAREYGGSFNSKEEALFTVPLLVEQGKLISVEEARAKARKTFDTMRKAHEEGEANQKRQREERVENLRFIQTEFSEMLTAGTLSNAQTVAITKAAELLGVKLTA